MSELLKKYEEAITNSVVQGRKQSEGDPAIAANFFDKESVYQTNFTTRTKGDKLIPLSNVGGFDTAGNFTKGALSHYSQEVVELDNKPLGHHKYDRSNADSHYINKNLDALGVSYQSKISEK